MELREAWNIINGYVGTLESLAETVDAYRDGDEVYDENDLSVSELEQRLEESGGQELIDEAWNRVYEVIEPLLEPVKKVES